MKLSYQWLTEFVTLPKSTSPLQLERDLTMHTVEVEGIESQGAHLEHIVVGKILEIKAHPNADKLRICMVDDGHDIFQLVCGGSNLSQGMLIAFGKIGAKVQWHGQGALIILEKATIRGQESYGMICAADEIGLGQMFPKKEEKEILDLTLLLAEKKQVVGMSLAEALGLDDLILDIENKTMTHRPDLWGHYGIAREIAAIYKTKLKPYTTKPIPKVKGKAPQLSVTVSEKALCPRYMAVTVDGVRIEPSPDWLQKKLRAVGLRPINNIVDITNYVMYDVGQPMHAFDASAVSSQTIHVRCAKKNEHIEALDDKEYTLQPEMLVIADKEKPLAIAGVIGGAHSQITVETKTIIFEAANCHPISVRKTAAALGIRTDSSSRFEKSLDPTNTQVALERAVELTLMICPTAQVTSQVVDINNSKKSSVIIELPTAFAHEKIGVHISEKEMTHILTRLGFGVKQKKNSLIVQVPSWRATKDISLPEDIVEEIARMYGYEKVPVRLPSSSITPPPENALRVLERAVKRVLAYELAYTEVYNYSFESPGWLEKIGIDRANYLELENPIAKDRPLIRRNLMPNLLQNIEHNAHRCDAVRLFEVGQTYIGEESGEIERPQSKALLPKQDMHLGVVFSSKNVDQPFFELSHVVDRLCRRLQISYTLDTQTSDDAPFIHPSRHAKILVNNHKIGRIAELHPEIQQTIGIPHRVAMLQINLQTLLPFLTETKPQYHPLSVYPAVERDLAFIVDRSIEHTKILQIMTGTDPLVVAVELFDVFEGEQIGVAKKSMAYHITYQSPEKTLTADDVDNIHQRLIATLKKEVGAEMRDH